MILLFTYFFSLSLQSQESNLITQSVQIRYLGNFIEISADSAQTPLDTLRRLRIRESDAPQWFKKTIVLKYDGLKDAIVHIRGLQNAFTLRFDSVTILPTWNEVRNPYRQRFELPARLLSRGEHVLEIRVPKSDAEIPAIDMWLGDEHTFDALYEETNYRDVFFVGVFCLATLFFLGLFYGAGKNWAYLLMAFYSFLFTAEHGFNFYSRLYTSASHILMYHGELITIISILQIFTINWFIISLYKLPYRKWLLLATLAVALMHKVLFWIYILPFFTTGLLIYAYRRGNPGAALLLLGWVSLMCLEYFTRIAYPISGYFIGLLIFHVSLVASVSKFIHRKTEKHRKIQLRHAELEADLLKSKIQPHFLMNTLTSIISWIELNPKNAVRLVKALSEEFRQIRSISENDLIDLETELNLCRTHLEVMSLRTQSKLNLTVNGGGENTYQIPPLIFHTLIENGLTHSVLSGEDSEFLLDISETDAKTQFTLKNSGSLIEEKETPIEEGFGLTYIRKRLQHSFANNWDLNYHVDDGFWVVTITLNRGKK